jgi:glutathione S-transferase
VLTLYQNPTAVCAVKVRLVLAEKDLQWEARNLDLRAGDQHKPEYLKLNPNGVVPTLVHDDRTLSESSVIMLYLDEAFPQRPLQPTDPWERAQMRLWMKRVDEVLHPSNITLMYATRHRGAVAMLPIPEREAHYARIPNPAVRHRQRQAIEMGLDAPDVCVALKAFHQTFEQMEEALSANPWLAGSQWSAADAAMTPYADRAESLGFLTLWEKSRPHVAEWCSRIRARPSYQATVVPHLPDRALLDLRYPGLLDKLEDVARERS